MSSTPESIKPCFTFATNALTQCADRNADRPWYNRLFFGENCGAISKRVFETCKDIAERTDVFMKPYPKESSEK